MSWPQFHTWTDHDGRAEPAVSRDDILDDISLYWLTGTAASSARMYWENGRVGFGAGRVDIPVGASVFPRDIFRAPRSWAEQCYSQLIHWNELPRGGHFAALEQPALFVSELRATFAKLR